MEENSDIGLMKTKNKGSGKVYKMVGRMTCLTEPLVLLTMLGMTDGGIVGEHQGGGRR